MTSRTRFLLAFFAAAAFGQAGPVAQQATPAAQPAVPEAQQEPAQEPERPTFRADINFVRVDVIVTDDGEPVTDLTEADFELSEDGKPQTIEQFRLIQVDGRERPGDPPVRQIRNRDDEVAEAARDDVRVIAIFLDDYHTRLGSALSVKRSLIQFIETQLSPNDMVAVMYPLTPVTAIEFTRNRASTISAINNFEGRKFRYDARNDFERQYERQPTEVVEAVRNRVSMSALTGLATRLGSIREGRKAVIYVSEGFTALLPPQLRRDDATIPTGLPISPMIGENNPNEERARVFAMGDIYMRMREVFTAFNRNNASIYSLDPRGLAVGEFGIDENVGPNQDRASLRITQDTLRVLSDETDGKAVVNRNDLAQGLDQLIRDSSYYYLIGYTSSAPTDGKFHDIRVRVKRRGVDVRGRRGFWAATDEDVRRASAGPDVNAVPRPVEEALAALAVPRQATQYARTWVGTERGADGKTKVTLVWEPLSPQPGIRREEAGRVSVIAAAADGDLIFRGRTPNNLPSPPAGPPGAGNDAPVAPQRIVFDAPPGAIEIRLSVEATSGGVIDNEVRKLTVPDLTTPQTALSTPRVFRARTARDVQTIVGDAGSLPATTREFSRTERILIRFDVYAEGSQTPVVTAALLNRSGQKMAEVPVTMATVGGTHQLDIGLASIPPAEYLVEITVTGADGDVKDLVAFRVVS